MDPLFSCRCVSETIKISTMGSSISATSNIILPNSLSFSVIGLYPTRPSSGAIYHSISEGKQPWRVLGCIADFIAAIAAVEVTEELKLPLLQDCRQAEHGQLTGTANLVRKFAAHPERPELLDTYASRLRLAHAAPAFIPRGDSISSVLYDTSQELDLGQELWRQT